MLREDGSVIRGLYATGVSTASVMGRFYPGAGSSVGPSFVWGYVAARLAHAWVHLGANRVRHRFRIYLISWIFLLALWVYVCGAVALK